MPSKSSDKDGLRTQAKVHANYMNNQINWKKCTRTYLQVSTAVHCMCTKLFYLHDMAHGSYQSRKFWKVREFKKKKFQGLESRGILIRFRKYVKGPCKTHNEHE